MIAVAGVVGAGLLRMITNGVLMFFAFKLLLTALFIVALPIVINNLLYEFIESSVLYMSAHADGVNAFSGALQATGVLAYLLECFKVPECLSVLIAAFQLHLILKIIPFSPVK